MQSNVEYCIYLRMVYIYVKIILHDIVTETIQGIAGIDFQDKLELLKLNTQGMRHIPRELIEVYFLYFKGMPLQIKFKLLRKLFKRNYLFIKNFYCTICEFFSGNYHVKFGHFFGQISCKIWAFCWYSYIYFLAEMYCPPNWLSSYTYGSLLDEPSITLGKIGCLKKLKVDIA